MSNKLSIYQSKKKLSDQQVADLSNLSKSYYNRIKNGRITPKVDTAIRIALVLERSVHTLWELEEE